MSATAKITPQAIIEILRQHPGADRGLKSSELVEMMTGERSTQYLERTLRQGIRALREEGFPICGTPEEGYYWAASSEEVKRTCAWFHSRAVSSLKVIGRLKRVAIPMLEGQLLLPVGAEPKIPSDFKPVDYSRETKVGMVVHIPEELYEIAKNYVASSGLDQDRMLAMALASFLFQEGMLGAAETYRQLLEDGD